MLLTALLLTPGVLTPDPAASSVLPQTQSPRLPLPAGRLLGEVRGPETPPKPLAGARLQFHPSDPQQLLLLRGLKPARLPLLQGVTDDKGRYSLPGATGPGSLLVEHGSGLGALVLHSTPGAPRIVSTQPMAELVLPALEGRPTTLIHVQALGPGGRGLYLGLHEGRRLLLPAGSYRFLLCQGARYVESCCELLSGRSQPLPLPEAKLLQTLQLWPGFQGRLCLDGWSQVDLEVEEGGRVHIPQGPGPRWLRIWEQRQGAGEAGEAGEAAGKVLLVQELWIQEPLTQVEPSPLKLRPAHILDPLERPVAEARVYAYRLPDGGPRLLSLSTSDAKGLVQLPVLDNDPSAFLLVVRQGFAPLQIPAQAQDQTLRLGSGHPLSLLLQDPKGDRLADVEVELSWPESPWLRMSGISDARGQLSFLDLPAGELEYRLIGSPYLETVQLLRLPLPLPAAARTGRSGPQVVVRAQRGYRVMGKVLLPSNRPAAGAQVLLRDAFGNLLRHEKVAITAADGSFVLHGLPKDTDLLLWATLFQGGQSWISRKQRVEAGNEEWILELRPEDPTLPGKLR